MCKIATQIKAQQLFRTDNSKYKGLSGKLLLLPREICQSAGEGSRGKPKQQRVIAR